MRVRGAEGQRRREGEGRDMGVWRGCVCRVACGGVGDRGLSYERTVCVSIVRAYCMRVCRTSVLMWHINSG